MPSYQSQSLNFLRRQVRQVREGAARTLRQGTMLTVWTLQVVLYPIYLVFQSSRVVGRQLQSSVKRTVPRLKAISTAVRRTASSHQPPSPPLTPDLPINNVLRSLPSTLPTLIEADLEGIHLELPPSFSELHAALDFALPPEPEAAATSTAIASSLAPRPTPATGLTHSSLRSLVAAFPDGMVNAPVRIQGLASLVSDRRLVLVAAGNGILDILSPGQQQRLRDRIILEIAHYHQRQRELIPPPRPALRRLPLPKVTEHQWLPVQWFRRVMAWMQTSDVAIATNIFQEALALPASPFTSPGFEVSQHPSPWHWHGAVHSSRPLAQSLNPSLSAETHSPNPTSDAASPVTPPPQFLPGDGLRSLWSQVASWFSLPTQPNPPDQCELELWSWENPRAIARSTGPSSSMLTRHSSNPGTVYSPSLTFNSVAPRSEQGEHLPSKLQPIAVPSSADDLYTHTGSDLQQQAPSNTSVEAQPEWIETSAIVVGYAKHPLEVILSWIDVSLVWVEQRLAQMWRWLMRQN